MKEHVAMVIKNSCNEILFIQRSLKKKTLPGIWAFPSGTVEEGEDFFQTAIREAKEELGIEVNPIKVFAATELNEFSIKLIFILCEITEGSPQILQPEEIEKIEYITFDNFFKKFSDSEIGHGLIWLRKNKGLLPV
ncbi:MAG: NUDIX hydrolase [Nanoarchaeota archaeon]|nr:NUDIX hydrolase [Nanoarchaeota archaeon]